MYDKKVTLIHTPDYIKMFMFKYNIPFDNVRMTQIVDDIIGLSNKVVYDVSGESRANDILNIIIRAGIDINDKIITNDLAHAIETSLNGIISDLVLNNIMDTVKYVLEITPGYISIESYRI